MTDTKNTQKTEQTQNTNNSNSDKTQSSSSNTTNTNTKTLQPATTEVAHHSAHIGPASIAAIVISLVIAVERILEHGWKFWSVKKGKIATQNKINNIEREYQRVKDELSDKKQDLLFDSTLSNEAKQQKLHALKNDYQSKLDILTNKKEELQSKLNGGK